MKKILIDTDIGDDIDDIFALTYLFSRKDADILGVTTVWGDTGKRAACANVIANAKKRPVPIFKGEEYNLDGTKRAAEIKGYMDFAKGSSPDADFGKGRDDAVDFIYRILKENPYSVTLIAIGPLTNIAYLFTKYPDAPSLLSELAIMGGAYFENPRCTWDIRVEWNFKCDPRAAKIVLEAPVRKISIYGVDLTWDYQLPRLEAAKLFASSPENAPQRAFAENIYRGNPIWFHDPLTVALTFEPTLGEFQRGKVKIELEDGEVCGKSTFIPTEDGNCFVCRALTVTDKEFFLHYQNTVK